MGRNDEKRPCPNKNVHSGIGEKKAEDPEKAKIMKKKDGGPAGMKMKVAYPSFQEED
jgi:hypothetical protein